MNICEWMKVKNRNVGCSIVEARKAHGISQKELAKRLGVTQSMVSQWENGTRNPRLQTIEKIAQSLGISLELLLEAA